MKTNLYIACMTLLFAVKANALTQPPSPPTMSTLANANVCHTYAESMFDYLYPLGDFTNLMNALWFKSFGNTEKVDVYRQTCTDGSCIDYYGVGNEHGLDPGCYIASTNAQTAKQNLLEHLSQAYQNAIIHQDVAGTGNNYGLYGDPNSCTFKDNYAGCSLYYKE